MPSKKFSLVEEVFLSFAYVKVAVGLPHCTPLQLCCHLTEVIVLCVLTKSVQSIRSAQCQKNGSSDCQCYIIDYLSPCIHVQVRSTFVVTV